MKFYFKMRGSGLRSCPRSGTRTPMNGPEADEYLFIQNSNTETILKGLNLLRINNQLCDVKLIVDGLPFPAHKNVLSSFSPYFHAMFTGGCVESNQDTVVIQGISAEMIELLLNFAYTCSIKITKNNCQNLLAASNLLQILSVREAACTYLEKHMNFNNCIGIHCFAETHSCVLLGSRSRSFILYNFQDVYVNEEFAALSVDKVIEFISDDNLNVENEEAVFEAVKLWYNENKESRGPEFHKVLEHVRLPLIRPYYLHDVVEPFQPIQENELSMKLLNDAKWYHLMPARRCEMNSSRTRLRLSSNTIDIIMTVGGEDEKVVLRSVEGYNPPNMSWVTFQNMPFALCKHGLVSSRQRYLYVAGGEFPDGKLNDSFWRYDPVLDDWQEMAPMISPRSEFSMVECDDYIYVIGGWNGADRINTIEYYDPIKNRWSVVEPEYHHSIDNCAAVSYKGKLYIVATNTNDPERLTSMVMYDPTTNLFAELPAMNTPRIGIAICVLDGFIYTIGGCFNTITHTNVVERYNINDNTWEKFSNLCEERSRAGACVLSGKLYVFGGEEGWERYLDSVECYDFDKNFWEPAAKLPSPRSWAGCAVLRCYNKSSSGFVQ